MIADDHDLVRRGLKMPGPAQAPGQAAARRPLRTKLGRLGRHRPDNRIREETGLSRDDPRPCVSADSEVDGATGTLTSLSTVAQRPQTSRRDPAIKRRLSDNRRYASVCEHEPR